MTATKSDAVLSQFWELINNDVKKNSVKSKTQKKNKRSEFCFEIDF